MSGKFDAIEEWMVRQWAMAGRGVEANVRMPKVSIESMRIRFMVVAFLIGMDPRRSATTDPFAAKQCDLPHTVPGTIISGSRDHTCSTKLSTTFFSPAFSKAMVSLLPSIFTTWP
jgi:hypothetical protein